MTFGALDTFFGYFNLVIGLIAMAVGWGVIHPFPPEKEDEIMERRGNFFRWMGLGLVVWGLINVL